jgi:hypothetical protein
MFGDRFNVIGFLKKSGYIKARSQDGYVLVNDPSVSNILDEIRKCSGDEITIKQFARLLVDNKIAIS